MLAREWSPKRDLSVSKASFCLKFCIPKGLVWILSGMLRVWISAWQKDLREELRDFSSGGFCYGSLFS